MLMRPTIQKFNLDIQNYNYVILKWGLVSFFFFRFPFSAVPMSCQLYSGSLLYYFLFDSDEVHQVKDKYKDNPSSGTY